MPIRNNWTLVWQVLETKNKLAHFSQYRQPVTSASRRCKQALAIGGGRRSRPIPRASPSKRLASVARHFQFHRNRRFASMDILSLSEFIGTLPTAAANSRFNMTEQWKGPETRGELEPRCIKKTRLQAVDAEPWPRVQGTSKEGRCRSQKRSITEKREAIKTHKANKHKNTRSQTQNWEVFAPKPPWQKHTSLKQCGYTVFFSALKGRCMCKTWKENSCFYIRWTLCSHRKKEAWELLEMGMIYNGGHGARPPSVALRLRNKPGTAQYGLLLRLEGALHV